MAGTLILLSGGMNSTVALYETFKRDYLVAPYHAITFNYGQEPEELIAAEYIFKQAIAKFIPSPVSVTSCEDLPNHERYCITYFEIENKKVTYENAFYLKLLQFLSIAAIYSINNDLSDIVIGISSNVGEERLPEEEKDFIDTVETTIMQAASLSDTFHKRPKLHIPLMDYTKSKIFKKANDLGILELILDKTITCHAPIVNPGFYPATPHVWGKGCGVCVFCIRRKKGWEQYQEELLQQEDKEKESLNSIKIGDTIYTGVGNPARWTILERDDDGKSSIVTTHGKQHLFTDPSMAWDWIKEQKSTSKFYTVTGQDAARHIILEQSSY